MIKLTEGEITILEKIDKERNNMQKHRRNTGIENHKMIHNIKKN
jgi:hypothetical protein